MSNVIEKTRSACDYPLLIRQLLPSPPVNKPDREIICRGRIIPGRKFTLIVTHKS